MSEPNIQNCIITEYRVKIKTSSFGNRKKYVDKSFTETIKVSIPASTPEWALQQMFMSEAVAVEGCNEFYNLSGQLNSSNYNYYTQNDGGSYSPPIRLVSLNRKTLRFNKNRNRFEVEGVMLG